MSSEAGATPAVQDISDLGVFVSLEPGVYSIDPDLDPSTPLRVLYEIPTDGWSSWIGAAKFVGDGRHVAVSISTVTNVVRHGCDNHAWADPPVGPTTDDLAAALADLDPFVVISAPEEVSAYGYRGTHLTITVPSRLRANNDGDFAECTDEKLMSWVAAHDTEPGDAFYGYSGPGYIEEFWILDVDGTRLMIASEQSAGVPAGDIGELHAILESIRIEM